MPRRIKETGEHTCRGTNSIRKRDTLAQIFRPRDISGHPKVRTTPCEGQAVRIPSTDKLYKRIGACLPVSSSTGIVRPPRVMLLMYSALRVLATGMGPREDDEEEFESARAK